MFATTPNRFFTAADGHGVWRSLAVAVFVVSVAASGAVLAQPMPGGPGMQGPGMAGHGHGGDGRGAMMMGNPDQIGRMTDRMLQGLNATDAQRSQIRQIATAAGADMKAQHDAGRALRQKGIELFSAPSIDAAAAEALRQQMQAQHDQSSKRMLQAMLDIGKVLTPEQRAKVAERMAQRGEMMHQHMRHAPQAPEAKG